MLLYANPLKRYVINSAMLDELVRDADGGFTLYVQHESPGPEKEPNWLPVPQGRFNLTFRAYQPEQAILDFTYQRAAGCESRVSRPWRPLRGP